MASGGAGEQCVGVRTQARFRVLASKPKLLNPDFHIDCGHCPLGFYLPQAFGFHLNMAGLEAEKTPFDIIISFNRQPRGWDS